MKNDFLTLIRTRRSIRAYKPDAGPAPEAAPRKENYIVHV